MLSAQGLVHDMHPICMPFPLFSLHRYLIWIFNIKIIKFIDRFKATTWIWGCGIHTTRAHCYVLFVTFRVKESESNVPILSVMSPSACVRIRTWGDVITRKAVQICEYFNTNFVSRNAVVIFIFFSWENIQNNRREFARINGFILSRLPSQFVVRICSWLILRNVPQSPFWWIKVASKLYHSLSALLSVIHGIAGTNMQL